MGFSFKGKKTRFFRSFVLAGSSLVAILFFQNCSNPKSVDGTEALSSNVNDILFGKMADPAVDYYHKAMTEAGDGQSDLFQGQTGIYLWGGQLLSSDPTKPSFRDSVEMVAGEAGFRAIRLSLGLNSGYHILAANEQEPQSLKDAAMVPQMLETLKDPRLRVIALTTNDFTSERRPTILAKFKEQAYRKRLYDEYFDFYKALFQLPLTERKIFVVSNWEGDNQIYYCKGLNGSGTKAEWVNNCNREVLKDLGQSLNDSIDAFTIWSLIRKSALLAARESFAQGSKVDIRFGVEFNQINMLSRSLGRSVLWDVIPAVKPDIVLYSSYESVDRKTLNADIDRIKSHLVDKGLTYTTIAIGEIGRTGTVAVQRESLRNSLTEVGRKNLAFAFAWNAFNGQIIDDPKSAESMGLWQPNKKLHVAPTKGLLVPHLSRIPDVPASCFSAFSSGCDLTVAGAFPLYWQDLQKAEIKCAEGPMLSVSAYYVTSSLVSVKLPLSLVHASCRMRVRSDIGFVSEWSNLFQVGVTTLGAAPPAATGQGYDIIVVGGQSNSSNGGIGPRVDTTNGAFDSKIDQLVCADTNGNNMLDANEASNVMNATDYVYDCGLDNAKDKGDGNGKSYIRSREMIGFAVSFARQYAQTKLTGNRRVLIVAGGVTGSGSNEWVPGRNYLANLLSRAGAALSLPGGQNRVVAFLWSQGEADIVSLGDAIAKNQILRENTDEVLREYEGRLRSIIQYSRNYLGQPKLPFLISEKAPQWVEYPAEKKRYQAMDSWIAKTTQDVLVVSSAGLTSNLECGGDASVLCDPAKSIHFSAQSNIYLGVRFFDAYQVLRP